MSGMANSRSTRRIRRLSEPEVIRFLAFVQRIDNCSLWTGSTFNSGYGRFSIDGASYLAHRVAYNQFVRLLDPEEDLDHRCHNESNCTLTQTCPHRRCTDPWHLVPTTARSNLLASSNTAASMKRAQTHCVNNHPFDASNTYIKPNGNRGCIECRREASSRHYLANKGGR